MICDQCGEFCLFPMLVIVEMTFTNGRGSMRKGPYYVKPYKYLVCSENCKQTIIYIFSGY